MLLSFPLGREELIEWLKLEIRNANLVLSKISSEDIIKRKAIIIGYASLCEYLESLS